MDRKRVQSPLFRPGLDDRYGLLFSKVAIHLSYASTGPAPRRVSLLSALIVVARCNHYLPIRELPFSCNPGKDTRNSALRLPLSFLNERPAFLSPSSLPFAAHDSLGCLECDNRSPIPSLCPSSLTKALIKYRSVLSSMCIASRAVETARSVANALSSCCARCVAASISRFAFSRILRLAASVVARKCSSSFFIPASAAARIEAISQSSSAHRLSMSASRCRASSLRCCASSIARRIRLDRARNAAVNLGNPFQ